MDPHGPHGRRIYRYLFPVRPDRAGAWIQALQVVDGAVDFQNLRFLETCFLELAVHVRGNDEILHAEALDPSPQYLKNIVRLRRAVQGCPVTVEPPAERRIADKMPGGGRFNERDSKPGVHRIR